MAELGQIQGLPAEQKVPAYTQLTNKYVVEKNVQGIIQLIQHLVTVEAESQHNRTFLVPDLLMHAVEAVRGPEGEDVGPEALLSLDQIEAVLLEAVEIIRIRQTDFPDVLRLATQVLAECHQANDRYQEAASLMARFDWNSDYGKRTKASLREIALWHIDTAELYLEGDDQDVGRALQQVNKCLPLTKDAGVRADKELMRRVWVLQARQADNTRRFLEASKRYLDLSRLGAGMSEAEVTETLRRAVTCAILADPVPARSRTLAVLYGDARTRRLGPMHALLEKMCKGHIVRPDESTQFAEGLESHQLVMTSTGRTVVQNAMIMHNLAAASRIYDNITFAELGLLLGISTEEAEALASSMMQKGQMSGSMDQVDQVVEFDNDQGNGVLGNWDHRIEDVCLSVNSLLESISKQWPQYEY